MNNNNRQQLWDDFLQRWPLTTLKDISLEQYVSVNDNDTFTYWLETRTSSLGSIKGNTSAKFGIYKRNRDGKEQGGIAHGDVYSWRTKYGHDEQSTFEYVKKVLCDVAEAAYMGDLDTIDSIDFAPLVKWKIAFLYQNQQQPCMVNTFSKQMLEVLTDSNTSTTYPKMYRQLEEERKGQDLLAFGSQCWEVAKEKATTIKKIPDVSLDTFEGCTSLNQILYGPPGTGKTYHTIEAAVKAAAPARYVEICSSATNEDNRRMQLREVYSELCADKRIRFVTFHQSYGYEEFVEGLSVKTVDGEAVYYEKDGIFKLIVEDAMKHQQSRTNQSVENFERCWTKFLEQLASDEEGVRVDTKRTFFTVTDVDNGTIRFEKDQGISTHSLNVKALKAIFEGERVINGGLNPYYSALIAHLKNLTADLPDVRIERKNYVLVIDEINRGNISKIFGELITLIEPSKRQGAVEAIELVLPYTGDKFTVPDNLYIIGTMNTADRSLAMMDTALRRRFDFIEMMPNPSILKGIVIKGIDLEALLETVNKRIEILYDREHTLGHAFFMPVKNLVEENKEQEAFSLLVSVFQNKVIPLLQEYFFEDWQKIRLVLGDNQRGEQLQLIKTKQFKNNDLEGLFGKHHDINPYGEALTQYSLKAFDEPVWQNTEVYRRMYAHPSKDEEIVVAQDETAAEVI
ncbi:AAA family ATPase [Enterovibrio sp. ZSDZ42]|uniref:AAA family ATPase n=1 Tax=Enterovibrio gelatinilyticus TaxID=2899819 RepID=A0ABT5QZE7_9GAMM|nr:AAA family ATPase [Enterovibrio sp. ZSDZ42]MDD1793139.1 AAA family ATPase [Enterovibrio sp. ZSDZ42]